MLCLMQPPTIRAEGRWREMQKTDKFYDTAVTNMCYFYLLNIKLGVDEGELQNAVLSLQQNLCD